MTLQQIIDTAGNAQLVSPLTYLEGSAPGTGGFIDGPNQRVDIRPVLPLGAPKDLAAVPITDAPGKPTLGEVANVVESHQPLIGDAMTSHGRRASCCSSRSCRRPACRASPRASNAR